MRGELARISWRRSGAGHVCSLRASIDGSPNSSVLVWLFLEVHMILRHFVAALTLVGLPLIAASQTQLQDKFFDSNGVSIRYVEAGSGEPSVLAHGNGGSL